MTYMPQQDHAKPSTEQTPAWLQVLIWFGVFLALYIMVYVGMEAIGVAMSEAAPVFLVILAIPTGAITAFAWLVTHLVRKVSIPPVVVTPPPAGWYVDPYGSGSQRWWNGSVWSDAVRKPPQ